MAIKSALGGGTSSWPTLLSPQPTIDPSDLSPRLWRPPAAMAMNAPNGKPPVNGIGLTHHHLDFTSHDVEGIRHFYADLLGFKNFLYIPEHKYLTIMISPTSSAGFMAPMPGPPEAWRPPGEPSFYFYVEDVDQACAALAARGVTIDQPPTNMPWGHRIATFRDPEGRQICVAKNIK